MSLNWDFVLAVLLSSLNVSLQGAVDTVNDEFLDVLFSSLLSSFLGS